MAQWLTNLVSVVVGAVIGVALEPAKASLLARSRTKRMRSILYEELAIYYRELQNMEKQPSSTYNVATWLEVSGFPMCRYFIDKDLDLFYRVPDAWGINGIRNYFDLKRKELAAGNIRETEALKLLLMVFEIRIAEGKIDRGLLEMWADKHGTRVWNSALGIRKAADDLGKEKRSYDS